MATHDTTDLSALLEANGVGFDAATELHIVRVAVADTTVTGNGTSADCGTTVVCADLDTDLVPRLDPRSTCDSSHVYGSGLPGSSWGVYALD